MQYIEAPSEDYLKERALTGIYVLIDSRTDEIRYIGKTVAPEYRLRCHIKSANNPIMHRTKWLANVLQDGGMPIMKFIDIVPNDDWQMVEQAWIAHGREEGWRLVNLTDGGEGLLNLPFEVRSKAQMGNKKGIGNKSKTGMKDSMETRHRKSISRRRVMRNPEERAKIANTLKGNRHSQETKRKISESHKGITHSEETKHKLSEMNSGTNHPMWGKKHSDNTKRKMKIAALRRYENPEELKRLSEAAKRGWETRRRNNNKSNNMRIMT